ncbi:MAG: low molecular weight phosphatase family protein [Verrucomicrobiota bacterium]
MSASHQRVLFICTGNYYRSRFAEAMFNHEADKQGLEWSAFSRGLRIHLAPDEISPFTEQALIERDIPRACTAVEPRALHEPDLVSASLVIALKQSEHLPMMLSDFPDWAARISYWAVHDLDVETHDVALPQIEDLVNELIGNLRRGCAQGAESMAAMEF